LVTSSVSLYDHQAALNDRVRRRMAQGCRAILVQACTGYGKTRLLLDKVLAAQAKGKKSVIVVPRRQLLDQINETLREFDVPHSFISSGMPYNPYARTYIATVGTLANRLTDVKPDVNRLSPYQAITCLAE